MSRFEKGDCGWKRAVLTRIVTFEQTLNPNSNTTKCQAKCKMKVASSAISL